MSFVHLNHAIEKSILSTCANLITQTPIFPNRYDFILSIPAGSRHSYISHYLYQSLLLCNTSRNSNLIMTRLAEWTGTPIQAHMTREKIILQATNPNPIGIQE